MDLNKLACSSRVLGMSTAGIAYCLANILAVPDSRRTLFVVVPSQQVGEQLCGDLSFFLDSGASSDEARVDICRYFGWEVLPFDGLSPSPAVSAERLWSLYRMTQVGPAIVVSTADALCQRIVPRARLSKAVHRLAVTEEIEREELVRVLDAGGYSRRRIVEESGDYAVRGAIVDFFPPGSHFPIRVELFDDEIESIRSFDTGTQRSREVHEHALLLPVSEALFLNSNAELSSDALERLRERASELNVPSSVLTETEMQLRNAESQAGLEHLMPLLLEHSETIWDYIPESAEVVICDEAAVIDAIDDFEALVGERAERAESDGKLFPPPHLAYQSAAQILPTISARASTYYDSMHLLSVDKQGGMSADARAHQDVFPHETLLKSMDKARRSERPFQPLVDEVERRRASGFSIAIAVAQQSRVRRVVDLLASYNIVAESLSGGFCDWSKAVSRMRRAHTAESSVSVIVGALSSGIGVFGERLIVIADSEIFPDIVSRPRTPARRNAKHFMSSLSQLQEGDFVVHVEHGIGLYRGLKQVGVADKLGDYLHLEYADGAKLFLPVDNIAKVQKYSGAHGKKPALTKLGAGTWEKTKKKVERNVAELAGQLLQVMAERETAPGFSFGEVDTEDLGFADAFPYEETPDQEAAIRDVLEDMEKPKPMDRLVCGDVGFGKTEVALRAAFKAVNAGKQVAFLVPTTILSDQHYQTCRERFAEYPIRIACVSRFFTPKENKETLELVRAGKVDILVGTHRILQKDVLFKDLGLIVIDEEHRFGVAHKERLKRLRKEVDVLTLTATPIPRTLDMALVGIRDLSIIETAPSNRQLIRTYVARYEDELVREGIMRELGRGGQVFFVSNRVENIIGVTDGLRELVPEARIDYGHGQMKERQLEEVMRRFIHHEIDVLVSTTIVESGLDIPNANTIIIRDSDRFGLAELYQLRGRVGRASRRAYAYLLVSDPKRLGDAAKRRIKVLQSLDDLGIGFRLALEDLEIRGAGNLLGKDQSGQVNSVGYELYSRILRDAVKELKTRQRQGSASEAERFAKIDPEMNIGFPAHIPNDYIPDVAERLLLYQRLIEVRNDAEVEELGEEIEDRFGHPPEEVKLLLALMAFRSALRRAEVVSARLSGGKLRLRFHPEAELNVESLLAAAKSYPGQIQLRPDMEVWLTVPQENVETPAELQDVLEGALGLVVCKKPALNI